MVRLSVGLLSFFLLAFDATALRLSSSRSRFALHAVREVDEPSESRSVEKSLRSLLVAVASLQLATSSVLAANPAVRTTPVEKVASFDEMQAKIDLRMQAAASKRAAVVSSEPKKATVVKIKKEETPLARPLIAVEAVSAPVSSDAVGVKKVVAAVSVSDATSTPTKAIVPEIALPKLPSIKSFNINEFKISVPNIKEFKISVPNIKEFKISVPETGLLSTTVRERSGGAEKQLASSKPFFSGFDPSTITAPALDLKLADIDALRDTIKTLPQNLGNWKFIAGLGALVYVADLLQSSSQINKLYEDQDEELKIMVAKLSASSKDIADASILREDITALAKENEILKAENMAAKLRSEAASGTGTKAIEELAAQVNKLTEELKLAKTQLSEARALSTSSSSARPIDFVSAPKETKMFDVLVAREKSMVEAVRKFVVEEGYFSRGVANMLMSASAPEMLAQAAKAGNSRIVEMEKKLAAAAATSAAAGDKEKRLEQEISQLMVKNEQLAANLYAAESKFKMKDNRGEEAQRYIKQLTDEVEEWKQKVRSSDEVVMDVSQDMQSKVESAKAMAKELNTRLTERTAFYEAKEAKCTQHTFLSLYICMCVCLSLPSH